MFDGERALDQLKQIASLGPRPTGSPALKTLRRDLVAFFAAKGFTCQQQKFKFTQPSRPAIKQTGMNLIASWRPDLDNRILFGTHYDTRPIADNESTEERRSQPIIGANDGASGVAFLMEFARWLKETDWPLGVDLVCFDAEEWIHDSEVDRLVVGSEHFARAWLKSGCSPHYESAVILDIIARSGAIFSPDALSDRLAPWLVDDIWYLGERLGIESMTRTVRWEILADHVPLLDVGIPTVILIDADDPRWHTLDDLPEFCSSSKLEEVGTLITCWLETYRPNP